MQNSGNTMGYIWEGLVPSPTGANHYELVLQRLKRKYGGFRPLQGLTIMNRFKMRVNEVLARVFPSPTGVNHYE